MQTLSTQTIIILVFLLAGLFWQCQDVPLTASKLVYLSADQTETARRPSTDCAFRYSIVNTFKRLDNDGQREAIRAGFDLWQKVNPNVGFLELPERATLLIQFVEPTEIPNQTTTTSVGLVRGSATVAGGLRKESSGAYTILLSNGFEWDKASLTKAIAYHAGLFLGLASSAESNSLMSSLFVGQSVTASRADSVAIGKLYTSACKDLSVSYLPFKLQVSGPITKTIKFDKQGTVIVKASGQINVGFFIGVSTPLGRDIGPLGFSPSIYNIDPTINHAALIYKLNGEAKWHYCGPECTFSTANNQYVDLTFNVNDSEQSNNTGAYDVVVDYK